MVRKRRSLLVSEDIQHVHWFWVNVDIRMISVFKGKEEMGRER